MRSASGARPTQARRSTHPACCWTARRSTARRRCGRALVVQKEQFVRTVTGKMLTYAIGRGLEYYDAPAIRGDRAGGRRRRLPLVIDDSGAREERTVSDEEGRLMIVTKKAISRRTILRGMGATVALPLLDAMIPALTAAAGYAGEGRPSPGCRLPSERRHLRQMAAERRGCRVSSSRRRLPDCSRSRTS